MSRNHFRNWLFQKDNQLSGRGIMPSESLDKALADRDIQKSIATNHKEQLLYSYIEHRIASDYAGLIDYKLREVFKTFTRSEFEETSGFERKEKSSFRQQHYFEVRNHFEYFLKHDIQQHKDSPDSEINAFKRWVEISNILLRRHCYDGFLLICVNLQLVEKPHLIEGLPECLRNNYKEMCRLCAPDGNHKALRLFIKKNQQAHDFPPLIFGSHAIGILNESLELLKQRKSTLEKNYLELSIQMDRLSSVIFPDYESYELLHTFENEQTKISNKLKEIRNNILDQQLQRDRLLKDFHKAQQHTLKPLPVYLEQTYHRVELRFNKEALERAKNAFSPDPPTHRPANPSTLFSQKLLPSFWNRRGKSAESFWKDIFTPSSLNP
jgi:hypothetical protein